MPDKPAGPEKVEMYSRLHEPAFLRSITWLANFFLLALVAGSAVPEINESHYLTKAKHALDAEYAPGDLFLESHDSHLISTLFAGLLAKFFPLSAVAWIGRLTAWGLMAYAWQRLLQATKIPLVLGPLALASWFFAVKYGHWAGEWAIGGFEGKAIAYPLVLLGLAAMVEGRWQNSWLWLALAVVWHPLVGGWAGLTVVLVWLSSRRAPSLWTQKRAVGAAFCISLVGVVPALLGIGGVDREGPIVASQIHVYFRLTHHLCPLVFDQERHVAAQVAVGCFIVANLLWLIFWLQNKEQQANSSANSDDGNIDASENFGRLLGVAWFALLFAAIGFGIDYFLSNPYRDSYRPELASKLLRFYWFRWSDVMIPLATVLVLWRWSGSALVAPGATESKAFGLEFCKDNWLGKCMLGLCTLAATGFLVWHISQNWGNTIPAADRLVVYTSGEAERGSGSEDSDAQEAQAGDAYETRHIEWLAVCQWIRDNTPKDAVCFTPKYQQSFKWYAGRAEVVCWKDVPQDNASVIEWFKRIQRCEPPRSADGKIRGWSTEELTQLSQEYDFEYAVVDMSYYRADQPPPLLEFVYPQQIPNSSFAVFRLRK